MRTGPRFQQITGIVTLWQDALERLIPVAEIDGGNNLNGRLQSVNQ